MEQYLEEKVDRMRRAEKPEKEKQLTQKGRVQPLKLGKDPAFPCAAMGLESQKQRILTICFE